MRHLLSNCAKAYFKRYKKKCLFEIITRSISTHSDIRHVNNKMIISREETERRCKVVIDIDEEFIIQERLKASLDILLSFILLRKARIKKVKIYIRGRPYNSHIIRPPIIASTRDLLANHSNERLDRLKIFYRTRRF